ncbi:UNVERIFIED_CONTAM: hypothetical protein RMT77_005761 [Armadillidium vulgare]
MKILKSENILLLMAAMVALICGVASQRYYNSYNNRVVPWWRSSFRRDSPAPVYYGRQSRSRSYSSRNKAEEEYSPDDHWPFSMF